MSTRWTLGLVLALLLSAGALRQAFAESCTLDSFVGAAEKNGWLVQELTNEERINFLNHLNRDDGQHANFYPPHVWETVQKQNDRIRIRVVFLDGGNCVIGNSGEIEFNEFSYLLAADVGF